MKTLKMLFVLLIGVIPHLSHSQCGSLFIDGGANVCPSSTIDYYVGYTGVTSSSTYRLWVEDGEFIEIQPVSAQNGCGNNTVPFSGNDINFTICDQHDTRIRVRVRWNSSATDGKGRISLSADNLGLGGFCGSQSFGKDVWFTTNSSAAQITSATGNFVTDCNASTVYTYSINSAPWGSSYNWILPTGWSFAGGAWGSNGGYQTRIKSNGSNPAGQLKVGITKQCGYGYEERVVNLTVDPAKLYSPATPTFSATEVCNTSNKQVNLPSTTTNGTLTLTPNSYVWEAVPNTSTFSCSGQCNTPLLAFNGNSSVSVRARASYGCGLSAWTQPVTLTSVHTNPPSSIVRTSGNAYTINSLHTFQITAPAGAHSSTQYLYTLEKVNPAGTEPKFRPSNNVSQTTSSTIVDVNVGNANGVRIKVQSANSVCGITNFGTALVKEFPFNNGLNFDGIDDYARVPHNNLLNIVTSEFTLEAWLRTDATGAQEPTIFAKLSYDLNQYTRGYHFGLDAAGKLRIILNGYSVVATNTGDLRDNQCHHFAVVRKVKPINTSYRIYEFYVDGTLVNSIDGYDADGITTDNFTIGNHLNSSSTNRFPFKRVLDEIRIWNSARTISQIQDWKDRSLVGNEPNLIGYWKLNDGLGQVIKDFGPNALHGTLGGSTATENSDPAWEPLVNQCSFIARKGEFDAEEEVVADASLRVYPNPAQDKMTILLPKGQTQATASLFTLAHKAVLTINLAASKTDIITGDLANGLYLLQIQYPNGSQEHKTVQIIR